MVAKRIIPCLDVKNGVVVKGTQFRGHQTMGHILELAEKYSRSGADELVFYDITASCEDRSADLNWITDIARILKIPFCVAGGIRSLSQAEAILNAGADKISINSPALENPDLIDLLAKEFGQQCVVVGIDSHEVQGNYYVCQYTGSEKRLMQTDKQTQDWLAEVLQRGAGEIVLNCMNQDGMRQGYDITQLSMLRPYCSVPLIASGGAGELNHFIDVFAQANVDGALAASVFHSGKIKIAELKKFLNQAEIKVRCEDEY